MEPDRRQATRRVHPAWVVAAVAFVALIGAAGFRAAPGVLILPLHAEFGWSRSITSFAVSVNLVLFGLTAPFAAALIDRFGIRRVTSSALILVAAGSGLTVYMTASWQLVLLWGVLVGLGTGSMALVFAATVANRWFSARRGLVMGILTAGSATGQLIFLPVVAWLADVYGWRAASLVIAGAALSVVPLVLGFLRDYPAQLGVAPYGAELDDPMSVHATPQALQVAGTPTAEGEGAAQRAIASLRQAIHVPSFWLLVGGFAICGATTSGPAGFTSSRRRTITTWPRRRRRGCLRLSVSSTSLAPSSLVI